MSQDDSYLGTHGFRWTSTWATLMFPRLRTTVNSRLIVSRSLLMQPSLVKVRIVCISDTHNKAPGEGYTLPKGDVLIHAGDLTNQGSFPEVRKAIEWIARAEFTVKIIVGGNHDLSLDPSYSLKHKESSAASQQDAEAVKRLLAEHPSITYLQHSRVEIPITDKHATLRVFGSPYSEKSKTQDWAFQYAADAAESVWSAITPDIDILISHTPPKGYVDHSRHWSSGGCSVLTRTVERTKPLLHICGHCHEGRGAQVVRWADETELDAAEHCMVYAWEDPGANSKKQSLLDLTGKTGHKLQAGSETAIINASIMARSFEQGIRHFNKPIVVDVLLPSSGT